MLFKPPAAVIGPEAIRHVFETFFGGLPYAILILPGLFLLIFGWLLYRGLDDFFNLERFFIKHYGQREAVIIRRDGTRTNEEFTYHRFARSRGAAMMLLALAWIIIGGLPLYLDYLAWLRG